MCLELQIATQFIEFGHEFLKNFDNDFGKNAHLDFLGTGISYDRPIAYVPTSSC